MILALVGTLSSNNNFIMASQIRQAIIMILSNSRERDVPVVDPELQVRGQKFIYKVNSLAHKLLDPRLYIVSKL